MKHVASVTKALIKMKRSSSQKNKKSSGGDAETEAEVEQLRLENAALRKTIQDAGLDKKFTVVPDMYTVGTSASGVQLAPQSQRMRQASVTTANILNSLPSTNPSDMSEKIIQAFKEPLSMMAYLHSDAFAYDIMKLSEEVREMFMQEPRCIQLRSPLYVFGDVHGNLEDLNFFSDNVWKLGMQLTAGKFLFLGDYVDRGMSSLECIAYLFAQKLIVPTKLYLLRGNHETRGVNGWEEHYGDGSFLGQCKLRFGVELGEQVWEVVNCAFDCMPLAAVIDNDIFCVHGGVPRPIGNSNRIADINSVPAVSGIDPEYEHETPESMQIASDCLWADPAPEDMEDELDEHGYGESPRGGDAVCFGNRAIDIFFQQHNFSYIMRAHEAHAQGVGLSKAARVFTVFSTSKNHGQGAGAMCGCVLVDNDQITVINRSPKYRNKHVHRRSSQTLANIPEHQLETAMATGLVLRDDE